MLFGGFIFFLNAKNTAVTLHSVRWNEFQKHQRQKTKLFVFFKSSFHLLQLYTIL